MSLWEAVAILIAGLGAGTINTIVGSGTLITFPTLLFFNIPPVVANVSNNIGLVAGGISGSWGYRHELTGRSRTLRRFMPLSLLGGLTGSLLLLKLPESAFKAIVPVLILVALILVVFGPRIQRAMATRPAAGAPDPGQAGETGWRAIVLLLGVFLSGIYGGYFGAAQGILMMGIFSALTTENLQRLNGFKNVLVTIVNFVAALIFVIFAFDKINWPAAALVGVGAFLGGIVGSRVGRRIPSAALRTIIIVVGLIAVVKMIWFS